MENGECGENGERCESFSCGVIILAIFLFGRALFVDMRERIADMRYECWNECVYFATRDFSTITNFIINFKNFYKNEKKIYYP